MRDELQQLPGVGPSISADLQRLGVKSIRDLARRDPERLYTRLCETTGTRPDPCVLYTFRCAVYAARTVKPDPELLKWWKWKNRTLGQA
jgi:Pathogenicity locus